MQTGSKAEAHWSPPAREEELAAIAWAQATRFRFDVNDASAWHSIEPSGA